MQSYLRTVGFSKVKSRKEMQEIIQDVINTYDEKIAVENHPDGIFVQYSKNYGCDCGITVCGQYDEDNEFHVEYSFPFFYMSIYVFVLLLIQVILSIYQIREQKKKSIIDQLRME